MEANVKRVISRLFAWENPNEHQLWESAVLLLGKSHLSEPDARSERAQNRKHSSAMCGFEHAHAKQAGQKNGLMDPFDYNQAMMDMGAMLCTPKNPQCGICPAAFMCEGKTSPEHYPAKKTAKKIPTRRVVILVQQSKGGKLLLERRDDALLGGLYGFPQTTPGASPGTLLGHITHVYSHFRLEAEVHLARTARTSNRFYSLEEIAALPLSKLDHKVLALLATAT
jgi:A/G-specific adenine glycosylase